MVDRETGKNNTIYSVMFVAIFKTFIYFRHISFRWTHVVVDRVEGKNNTIYSVVFVATNTGYVRKITTLPNEGTTCLLEEIKVVPNGDHKPIKEMKLSKEAVSIMWIFTGLKFDQIV